MSQLSKGHISGNFEDVGNEALETDVSDFRNAFQLAEGGDAEVCGVVKLDGLEAGGDDLLEVIEGSSRVQVDVDGGVLLGRELGVREVVLVGAVGDCNRHD